MLAVAGATGDPDLVFPEAAALAFGVLALGLPGWSRSPVKLALVPAACAAVGIAIVHLQFDRWIGEVIAITVALALLHVVSSRLTPSISAAAFRVVFDVRAWYFPITVLVIGVALTALSGRSARVPAAAPADDARRLSVAVVATTWAVAAGWIVVAGPLLGLAAATVAPPLVVAMAERVASADASAWTGLRHWLVLVVAAAAGAAGAAFVHPSCLGGVLALGVVLVAFALASGPHPPALAIALIPQVTAPDVGAYVAAIAIGAAVLYVGAGVISHPTVLRLVRAHRWRSLLRLAGDAPAEARAGDDVAGATARWPARLSLDGSQRAQDSTRDPTNARRGVARRDVLVGGASRTFSKGRVGVNGLRDRVDLGSLAQPRGQLGDRLAAIGGRDGGADESAARITDQCRKSVGLARGDRAIELGVVGVGHGHLLAPAPAGLRLGQTDASDLGIGERHRRQGLGDLGAQVKQRVGRGDPRVMSSDMRERQQAGHVPDRVDAGVARAQPLVDDDRAVRCDSHANAV